MGTVPMVILELSEMEVFSVPLSLRTSSEYVAVPAGAGDATSAWAGGVEREPQPQAGGQRARRISRVGRRYCMGTFYAAVLEMIKADLVLVAISIPQGCQAVAI